MSPTSKVVVIDDDKSYAQCLASRIRTWGFDSCSYHSAHDFLNERHGADSGCVIADLLMPGLGGLELLSELRRRHIGLPVIFLTGHNVLRDAVRAIKAGGFDFFVKDPNDLELLDAINKAINYSNDQRAREQRRQEVKDQLRELTDRERDVLTQLVDGRSTAQIAERLSVSPKTIDYHRSNILRKLKAKSTTQLVGKLFRDILNDVNRMIA